MNYLLLRKKLGKATPAELEELGRAFLRVGAPEGGGLAIPAPCANAAEWRARYDNKRKHD